MTGRITHIWRHPIKSHGREALDSVMLTEGQTLPWDRHWAVAHTESKADGSEWAPCGNFTRVSKAAKLQAVSANLNEETREITLRHPDMPELTFAPDNDTDAFITWANQLVPESRAQSARVVSVAKRGMTDTDYPSISLNSHESNAAVREKADLPIEMDRWRGNIWFDGFPAWEESSWIGKNIRIGKAELEICAPIGRCTSTMANAINGERDCDMLKILQDSWGHMDFGVYGRIIEGGRIAVDDDIAVLS